MVCGHSDHRVTLIDPGTIEGPETRDPYAGLIVVEYFDSLGLGAHAAVCKTL